MLGSYIYINVHFGSTKVVWVNENGYTAAMLGTHQNHLAQVNKFPKFHAETMIF